MGSAAAVVIEVSSDDEDGWRTPAGKRKSTDGGWRTPGAGKQPPDGGWRTPGAGKDKSPDSGLEWAEKLLGEDCDEIGDGLDDSEAMQELLKSLMDETNIVVEGKQSSVDDPEEKNSLRDADDDDDDCVILDGDPVQAIVVAKEDEPRRDAMEDDLQIVAEKGELACRDFPHPRHLCVSLAFNTSSHASHCSMCHCYVCDSPAPCAFWGKGTGINDHCHATDKDAKWKRLRQSSKRKSQQMPNGGGIQNLLQSTSATTADVMIPSARRFPVSRTVSQNQQVHPSIMVSQNTGHGVFLPRAPSYVRRTTTPSNRLKRARPAPPVYTPSNGTYLQPPVSNNSPMQPALPRGFQTAQIPPENTFGSFSSLRPPTAPPALSVPKGSQGYQRQPIPYPQAPPNTVVGTGVPLSRCTSVSIQGKQHSQGTTADAMRMRDALTDLAHRLGVPDYNIEPPVVQQSASTPQTLRPNQLLAKAMASQRGEVNQNYIAGRDRLILRIPRHNSSNHTSGSIALLSGAVQTKQPLCQLNSESSLDQNETAPSTVVRSLPWNFDGK